MSAPQSFHLAGAVQNGKSNVISVKVAYFSWIVCPYARNLAEAPDKDAASGKIGWFHWIH